MEFAQSRRLARCSSGTPINFMMTLPVSGRAISSMNSISRRRSAASNKLLSRASTNARIVSTFDLLNALFIGLRRRA